jgi:hypothetical protein
VSCSIYSYVLGPNRNHDFDSLDEALVAVKEWHAEEMKRDYADDVFATHAPEVEP